MLNDFIKSDQGRSRYLSTPFGEFLDGYIAQRRGQGFAFATIQTALQHVTAFGEYLLEGGIDRVSGIDESHVEAFVNDYRRAPRGRGTKRQTPEGSHSIVESLRADLRSLLAYLRSVDAVSSVNRIRTPRDKLVDDYVSFLRVHRGFAQLTLDQHQRWAGTFVEALASRSPPVEVCTDLSVVDVQAVVVELAGRLGRRCRQIMTTTVEAFLRYLRSIAAISSSCVPFLPRLKSYAMASLPSCIDASDVPARTGCANPSAWQPDHFIPHCGVSSRIPLMTLLSI